MKALDEYLAARAAVFAEVGYVEDWRVLPIDDRREYYWRLDGEGPGTVRFAASQEELRDEEAGEYFTDEIYTQRHLRRWVYRGECYTMVVVDTHTDGNQFLAVFANDKEG